MTQQGDTAQAARPVKEVYAVSRLVREARCALEGSFPLLWVEGEISNLAMPASGHIYFTLKDKFAQVRCAIFSNQNRQLRIIPENGMQVLLCARVTLYEGRGEFQLVVQHLEEAGTGALQRAYEALKHRLGEQGLFDKSHKKQLPSIPNNIGIISSPDGAAVHDILTVLNRRFPSANVILYPVAVQGRDSAQQIVRALALAGKRQECDVLIIGRGGGSLEDLWSFNEEQVARAIFACELPIISAVGHEIDCTIADFVADVRAATPSAAAEIAVPDAPQWITKITNYRQRLTLLLTEYLNNESRHITHLGQRLSLPQAKIEQQLQRLDRLTEQCHRSYLQVIKTKRQHLDYWSVRLKRPQAKIATQRYKVASLNERLQQSIKNKMDKYSANLSQQLRTLSAVSPLNTLERGYSITTDNESGAILRNSVASEQGQYLNVRLQYGQLLCEVKAVTND